MNLWNLTSEWESIEAELESSGGELTPEMAILLPATREALMEKGKNFLSYLRKVSADVKTLKDEAQRIADLKKTAESKEKSLKEYLKAVMQQHGLTHLDFVTAKARLQNNSQGSLIIEDESKLPKEYMIPQPSLPDKEAIKTDLAAGFEIEGCSVVTGKHVRIS